MIDLSHFENLPRPEWFYLQPPSRLHGAAHTARVMVWAYLLTRDTPWTEAVLWAAACHDLRRMDDGRDLQHGQRAGMWVREHLPQMVSLDPEALTLVANACAWHTAHDHESSWDHPVLWYLKDADGLDRVRISDLNPEFLRFPESRSWISSAQRLFDLTDGSETAAPVWQAARAMLPLPGSLA